MDRSPASSTWFRSAAAAAAYVAFWVALGALAAPDGSATRRGTLAAAHAAQPAISWSVAHRVYDEVERRGQRLGPAQRLGVARTIVEEAARAAIDPLLVVAVIHVESKFDVRAVSGAGALGLMQLLRPTLREEAARSGLPSADPFDPVANVRAGVRYLVRMVDAFDDVELALMAYNAGPARIRRHLREGGVPQRLLGYPRTVLREAARLSSSASVAARAAPAALVAAHARPDRDRPQALRPARAIFALSDGAPRDGNHDDAAPPRRRLTRARSPS
jgi:soluble lytic murein transglycosylase-like protein